MEVTTPASERACSLGLHMLQAAHTIPVNIHDYHTFLLYADKDVLGKQPEVWVRFRAPARP